MSGAWRKKGPQVASNPRLVLIEERDGQQHAEPGSDLVATIQEQIIPRLLLAHHATAEPSRCSERVQVGQEELAALLELAVKQDVPAALGFVESLASRGLSLQAVFLELIAPVARQLGDDWLSDVRSFTEVTAGLMTLQQLVNVLGPSFATSAPHRGLVVLLAAPGEQHTLGLYLVAEFLRRAGFGVQVTPELEPAQLLGQVASEHVEMLGFTVSNSTLLVPLGKLIRRARKVSLNERLLVMIGGGIDLTDFALQHDVFVGIDALDAVRQLERHAKIPTTWN